MDAARLMTSRIVWARASPSLATATAVAIVPHVPWECTFARGGVDGGFGKRVDAHLGRDLGESIEVVGHWSERREAGALRGWRAVGTAGLRPTKTRRVTGDPSADCAAERRPRPRAREVPAVARLLLELARRGEHHLTAHQRHPRPATHLPALVGREAGDPEVVRLLDRPRGLRVPERQIGVGARPDHALLRVEAEDARRVLGEHARE